MDTLRSMAVLISQPALALVPAAILGLCGLALRSRVAWGVGALWLLYCLYEFAMKLRILCSGECNIRIDLLVLYPVLLLATALALVAAVRAAVKRAKA